MTRGNADRNVKSATRACAQRVTASRVDPTVGAEPSILRDVKYDAIGILEFPFEVSETIVAEVEKECSSGGLDFLLRFRQIVNLEAKVIGSDCLGGVALDVVALAAGKIEQCKIDDAVAHVDRRANFNGFTPDLLEVEHIVVELCRFFQVSHADREVA